MITRKEIQIEKQKLAETIYKYYLRSLSEKEGGWLNYYNENGVANLIWAMDYLEVQAFNKEL